MLISQLLVDVVLYRGQLAYMTQQHFCEYLRFFLHCVNEQKREYNAARMSKDETYRAAIGRINAVIGDFQKRQ